MLNGRPKKRRLVFGAVAGVALVAAVAGWWPALTGTVFSKNTAFPAQDWQESTQPVAYDFFRDFDPSDGFSAAQLPHDLSIVVSEAITYTRLLQQYDDEKISTFVKSMKYQNMAKAATLLSATSEEKPEQRKWSGMAIEFGRIAQESMKSAAAATPDSRELMDEINTRRLIAMALNYYQGGRVSPEELAGQYRLIDESFLIRKGFCKYKVLRAMEKDGIILLPRFLKKYYI